MKAKGLIQLAVLSLTLMASWPAAAQQAPLTPPEPVTDHRRIVFRLPFKNAMDRVHLSCGWHKTCLSPYPMAYGLDFSPGNGGGSFSTSPNTDDAYLSASFHKNGSSEVTQAVKVRLTYEEDAIGTGCHEVTATAMHNGPGGDGDNFLFKVVYQHASKSWTGATIDIFATAKPGDIVIPNKVTQVGDMVNSEGCPWEAEHVHVKLCASDAVMWRAVGGKSTSTCSSSAWRSAKVRFQQNDYVGPNGAGEPPGMHIGYGNDNGTDPGATGCPEERDTSGNACDTTYGPYSTPGYAPYMVWTIFYDYYVATLNNELISIPAGASLDYPEVPYVSVPS